MGYLKTFYKPFYNIRLSDSLRMLSRIFPLALLVRFSKGSLLAYLLEEGLEEPYYTKGATDFIVRLLLAVWIKYSLLVELLAALSVYFQD